MQHGPTQSTLGLLWTFSDSDAQKSNDQLLTTVFQSDAPLRFLKFDNTVAVSRTIVRSYKANS